jgi:F0F1-type ATP synthase assembly protein I
LDTERSLKYLSQLTSIMTISSISTFVRSPIGIIAESTLGGAILGAITGSAAKLANATAVAQKNAHSQNKPLDPQSLLAADFLTLTTIGLTVGIGAAVIKALTDCYQANHPTPSNNEKKSTSAIILTSGPALLVESVLAGTGLGALTGYLAHFANELLVSQNHALGSTQKMDQHSLFSANLTTLALSGVVVGVSAAALKCIISCKTGAQRELEAQRNNIHMPNTNPRNPQFEQNWNNAAIGSVGANMAINQ